jgi:2-keto-3-deoxy-L-rhamnonate aldolase RhmA
VELFPHMTAMMKVSQEPRTFIAARTIGAGIQNLLFADPRSVQEVEECVKATRSECPGQSRGQGIHGVGMQRDVGVVLEGGTPAWVQAQNDAVCAIMIEKKQAVDDIEQLLAVPGVDMIQFGATDCEHRCRQRALACTLAVAAAMAMPSARPCIRPQRPVNASS